MVKPITVIDKRNTPDADKPVIENAADTVRPLPEKKQLSPAEIEAAMAFHYAEGRTTATVHEVYDHGLPLWCFLDGKPNCCLVRPIRRPAVSAGGVIVSTDEKRGTLGTNALCYLVLAVGDVVDNTGFGKHPLPWKQGEHASDEQHVYDAEDMPVLAAHPAVAARVVAAVNASLPFLDVKPGDVVVLRNAMLEPLDETLNTCSIHRSHLLSKVDVSGH